MAGTMRNSSLRRDGMSNGLNGVRPRWPEQCPADGARRGRDESVSMESGLDGRNNFEICDDPEPVKGSSQWSPA